MALSLSPNTGRAQTDFRPGDERPRLPDERGAPSTWTSPTTSPTPPQPPALRPAETAVPPTHPRPTPSAGKSALAITASGFQVVGCTAFDREALDGALAPFLGRPLSTLDLLDAVEAVRSLYHDAGFETTEVALPDQDLQSGVVTLQVLEGRLEALQIEGALHHREAYFRFRLLDLMTPPLDVPRLRARLEALQREAGLDTLAATLEEWGPAQHRLRLEVREVPPWQLLVAASNHRSPSIGSLGGHLEGRHLSLLGFGDQLALGGQWSEGLDAFRIAWQVPITPWGTRFGIAYRHGQADIVEAPFSDFDIQGRFESVSLSLRHPLIQTATVGAFVEAIGEWRSATSSIFGRVECFQADLADCTPTAAVLRLRGDLSWRSKGRALAARTTLSLGLDALGASRERDAGDRDGEFVSGLLQVQYAERLPTIPSLPFFDGTQLLVRADLQLASDPLLAVEQIAVGGARTVRGYRQNQLVRDNGAIVSAELRIPLWRSPFDRPFVEFAPFVDYGSAWDRRRGRSSDESLVSAGFGLRFSPTERLHAALTWAHRFRDDLVSGDRLQSRGLTFEVAWRVF